MVICVVLSMDLVWRLLDLGRVEACGSATILFWR